MKATKKPIEVEYYPCELEYLDKILEWSTKDRPIVQTRTEKHEFIIHITTLEGAMLGRTSDVIIKGVNGEVYPCKKDIFEKTYTII